MTAANSANRDVIAVTPTGDPIDAVDIWRAHTAPAILHLAISVMLRSPDGWIVQQRAANKPLFALRWANSCCTHPFPGETPIESARRRVREELGLDVGELTPCGTFTYRAVDPATDLVEHEFDHVFVGEVEGDASPNPAEVAEIRYLSGPAVIELFGRPEAAPWAASVAERTGLY